MMPVSHAMESGDLVVDGVVTPGAAAVDSSATKRTKLLSSASHASFINYGSSRSSPSTAMLLSTPPCGNTPRLTSSRDKSGSTTTVSISEATALIAPSGEGGADRSARKENDLDMPSASIKDGTLLQQVSNTCSCRSVPHLPAHFLPAHLSRVYPADRVLCGHIILGEFLHWLLRLADGRQWSCCGSC